jgi:hypothetical protein
MYQKSQIIWKFVKDIYTIVVGTTLIYFKIC